MNKRKNLLFIFADQWRRCAMSCAENPDPVRTPNMDAFAKENVYCTNAISSCPLCSPHRAALLTGKHAFATGVITNCKPRLPHHLKDEEIAITDVLHNNNYHTGYLGKWHLDVPEERSHLFPTSGAKRWDAFTPPGPGRHGVDEWISYGAFDSHMRQHYWHDTPERIFADKWSPAYESDLAIDFMNRHKEDEEPFALFVSWNPPHPPYDQVPQEYVDAIPEEFELRGNARLTNIASHTPIADNPEEFGTPEKMRTTMRRYFGAVEGIDKQFGRIVEWLKENNLYEDTYIVLSADHGDMMASHGMMGKHVWYEESIGIPFLISGPKLNSGKCDTVIGSEDVAPTLLDLLDLPIPKQMQGISCANSIIAKETIVGKDTFLQACPGLDAYLNAFDEAGLNHVDFGWRGIRTNSHTFIAEVGYMPSKSPVCEYYLYDLIKDPMQLAPIKPDFENDEIAKDLFNRLKNYLTEQNDGFMAHIK